MWEGHWGEMLLDSPVLQKCCCGTWRELRSPIRWQLIRNVSSVNLRGRVGCCGSHSNSRKTIFFCPAGTEQAWWKGDFVWWVSLVALPLSTWKSTVLRGVPSFFAHITILWHHVTGSPIGTGSISQSDILVQSSLYVILPVNGDRYRSVMSCWWCWLVNHQGKWFCVFHR